MRKIFIGDQDSNVIFDIWSNDKEISRAASERIQEEFSKAALQLHEMIKKRIETKYKGDLYPVKRTRTYAA